MSSLAIFQLQSLPGSIVQGAVLSSNQDLSERHAHIHMHALSLNYNFGEVSIAAFLPMAPLVLEKLSP